MANNIVDPSGNDLLQMLAQQTKAVQEANANVAEILPQVQQTVVETTQNLANTTDVLADKADKTLTEMQDISEKIAKVKGNPVLDLLGLVNPEYSTSALQQKFESKKLELTRLQLRQSFEKEAAQAKLQAAEQQMKQALLPGKLRAQELANTTTALNAYSTAFQIQIAQERARREQVDRALLGTPLEDLQAALEQKKPELVAPGATMGDLRIAIRQLKTLESQAEEAALKSRMAQLDYSAKAAKAAEEAQRRFFSNMPPALQREVMAQAEQLNQEGKNYSVKVGDTEMQIPFRIIQEEYQKSLERSVGTTEQEKKLAELKFEDEALQAARKIGVESSTDVLFRYANQTTGGAYPGVPDKEALVSSVEWLPPNLREAYAETRIAMAAAENVDDPAVRSVALEAASKKVEEMQKKIDETLKDTTPALAASGTREFLQFGQINSVENAVGVLTSNLSGNIIDPIARPGWAEASQTILANYSPVFEKYQKQMPEIFRTGEASVLFAADPAKSVKEVTVVRDVVRELTSNKAVLAQAQAQVLGRWKQNYYAETLQRLAESNPEAFGGFVTASGAFNTEAFPLGPDGKLREENIILGLEERTKKLQESGVLKPGESLTDIYVESLVNPENRKRFFAEVIAPRTAIESALAQVLFSNRESQAFAMEIAAFRSKALQAKPQAEAFLDQQEQKAAQRATKSPYALREFNR